MADPEQTPRLRPAQVFASSLAAVTGAFLASRLGVYGTVIGVGVISLFSTIGTDIYVRSLERTRQMAVWSKARTIALSPTGTAAETVELPRTADTGELSEPAATGETDATSLTAETGRTDGDYDAQATEQASEQATEQAGDSNPSRWTRARVLVVAAGAIASFALAFGLITGIESVSGSSLSGGGRTTLGELIVDGGNSSSPGDSDPDDVDAPEQPVPTPEPTTPPPGVTDPSDGEQDVPPAEEAPDVEEPSDPETPSPTESPTPEPTEPPADGADGSSAGTTDSQATGG